MSKEALVNISGSVEAASLHDIHSNLYHLNVQKLELYIEKSPQPKQEKLKAS